MARCSCCSVRVLFVSFLVCVAFFIACYVLAFKAFDDILYFQVNKGVRLEKDTEQYDRFVDLPFAMDFKVYVFNVENPDEIIAGKKPRVTEVGPFVYKQYRHKTIKGTNCDDDTITYTQMETFEFDEEASAPLTENQVVTVLNPALMSMYQLAEEFFMAGAVDTCSKSTFPEGLGELFITTPVKNLFFDGFNFCYNNGTDLCSIVNDIVCLIASTKRNTDTLLDYSLQFSFLNYKRREDDGVYMVNRGIDEVEELGHITAWNEMKYTQYWGENTTCSEVKGSDSTLYPPRVTEDSSFFIFSTDVCRVVEINYQGEDTYKDVDGLLFGTNEMTLTSSEDSVQDDCYCSMLSKNPDGKVSCFLDGVIDMQTCFGVPVLFSFPHFLWADEHYLNNVEGLEPNADLHKTFLLVEPNTGTPLQGVKRIQLNAVIRPILGVKSLLNMNRAVLPLVWIEEGVSLPDDYVDKLYTTYFDKVKLLEGFKWALVAISTILVIVVGGFLVRKKYFQK